MADDPYQIKGNIRKSGDNLERIISGVQPLTRSDVQSVMSPLRDAEKTIESAEAKSQSYDEEIHDVIRFEILSAKALLAFHSADQGERGEPLADYRNLTVEEKITQIDRQLMFAEERLASISPQTINYYYDESYQELEEGIFALRNTVEEISEELRRARDRQHETSYTRTRPQPKQSTSSDSSDGDFMVGAVLALIGFGCLITGVGAIIGVPLLLVGGAIMFPTLAAVIIGLMIGVVLILLL